jgi:N-acetylglutamate synthase
VEFAGAGRLTVRLTRADVGKRVSIRRVTGAGDDSGKFTDTVGVLTSWDDDVMLITRKSGERVEIPVSSLVAGKVVPEAPVRRRGPAAGRGELARVAASAWQPEEVAPLGGWRLRWAAGFTKRANSVLPLGDPGMPLDEALARVRAWYEERGLPAYVQTETESQEDEQRLTEALTRCGWRPEGPTEVWTGALAPVGDLGDTGRVRLSRTCDDAWLSRYHRAGGDPGPHIARVLHRGPSVWFATVPADRDDAPPAAIGRCVADGRWAGFMAVEVDPAHRRRGLARAVMAALARRALDEGASAAWLQVEDGNEGARALYTALGFARHHAYQYFRQG